VDFDHSLNKAINKLREALATLPKKLPFYRNLAKRGYRSYGPARQPRQIRSLLVLPLEISPEIRAGVFCRWSHGSADYKTGENQRSPRAFENDRNALQGCTENRCGDRPGSLQIEGVVEGTVLRSGEQVRISAQLIHVPQIRTFGGQYERDLRNVLGLQSEMAQAIAREVQVKVTPQEQAQLARVHTVERKPTKPV